MDKWQAALIGAKYVPIGGHPGLKLDADPLLYPEPFDVAYLGYMTYRRQRIYNELQGRGVRMPVTSAWGTERHNILSASRAYLHVHQSEEFPAVPGLRLVVAAAYKLPVIMEECADLGVFGHVYTLPSGDIAKNVRFWLYEFNERANDAMNNTGEALHDFLCRDLTFRASVERAL